jgi:hypothetical protein
MSAALTRSLVCLALVFALLSSAEAADPSREALVAARYALTGRNVDDIKVAGHGFNVYAATKTDSQKVTTITGRIAHRLRLRQDDQVTYVIKKQGDRVLDAEIRIMRGGFTGYTLMVMNVVTLNQLDTLDQPEDFHESPLFQKFDGSWEKSAGLIVAMIAKKARAVGGDPNAYRPDPRPSAAPKTGNFGSLPTVSAAVLAGGVGKAKEEVKGSTKK